MKYALLVYNREGMREAMTAEERHRFDAAVNEADTRARRRGCWLGSGRGRGRCRHVFTRIFPMFFSLIELRHKSSQSR